MKNKLKKLLKNKDADVKTIGAAVGLLITLMISILVVYNIAGSVDTTTIDADIGLANNIPSANATNAALDQTATFYTIAPIIVIVMIAVVILKYVGMI